MNKEFKALRISEENGEYIRKIENRKISDLPEGEVLVRVKYSSLNYKDALSVSGNKGVTRKYPHTPGIDAAGIVEASTSEKFKQGDEVIVTSYDLGMNTDGGFAEYIRVPESWVVILPKELSFRDAMIYGTAGFTAALSVYKLLASGQTPEMGPVVVTGALGGVGSIAISILSSLGFEVIAATFESTGDEDVLHELGASTRISKEVTDDQSGRPLLRPQWAGAIDVIGGNTLHTLLKACKPLGTVTCCGNVGSGDLPMSVYPFILNGISLVGIDSQNCPMHLRQKVWDRLAAEWNVYKQKDQVIESSLEDLDTYIDLMLQKKSKGRVIVKL
ncbi:YhdH/YhfP family quinone oxidoreductase [Marinifilum caeruleilacunae]|jgi:putative YhdH/YhfP family quinone oxidoreductase|uniref:Acryloyl-CoA reductase n=1 Tax=Marinifilum caeruleilacunae TaxID=2499076 RepID=A0ABX1WZG1_9BACT|nr:YhdH/YhfP family quinone oxidoreductase [Marinifilum caeruleilacunae]NOU61510.1 acryloyl-CoA reductase [Marinifilum caeruleilacunae]